MPAEWPDESTRPARRAGVSSVELDDNLAVYDEVGQLLILLNTSAAAVWELCDGAATVEQIGLELTRAHDGPPAVIAEDVRQTVRKLAELGLVVEGEAGAGVETDPQPEDRSVRTKKSVT